MTRRVYRLIGYAIRSTLAAACVMGGYGCQKSVEDSDATIDKPPISEKDPKADRPLVQFPQHLQTNEPSLNQFIVSALQTCATGDYDAFRQLFGSSFKPPGPADFERIWYQVQSVEVISVHAGQEEPPEYYVHATVKLRIPDRRDREKRDVVVAVVREADEWRMAQAPKEAIHKVLVVDSQPATESSPSGDVP